MKMSGTRQLPASQNEVWSKLNDVEVLKRCIPGCQSLEQVADNQLKAVVGLKVGPINAKFNGDVTLSDMDPPNSYRISGTGKGGAAGSASGGADVKLMTVDGGTELSYDVDAKVNGKIAQLGARLIDATAANLANKFFDAFADEFTPVESATAQVDDSTAGTETVTGQKAGDGSYIWWIVGIAIAAVVAWLALGQ